MMIISNQISEVTRRAIIDHFAVAKIDWSGHLIECEFLARLYDLEKLPSTDHRFNSASGDIRQHRTSWQDWPNDWVFYDSRFNLLHASDEKFLAFLIETVHPVVRPDSDDTRSLVDFFNNQLKLDGWEIFEKADISGRPVFGARKVGQRAHVFAEPTGWKKVDRQLQETRLRLDTASNEEQFQAVGLICREVLITLSQIVYDPDNHRPIDGVMPSQTDATRMLGAFFEAGLSGGANKEARAYAKAASKLAVALQHKRTADFKMAALCAEATASVVNLVAVLSGRRG